VPIKGKNYVLPDTAVVDVIEMININVDENTSLSSRKLTLKAKLSKVNGDDGLITVNSVETDGGIGNVDGKKVHFKDGPITIGGAVKKFTAYYLTNTQLVVQNVGMDAPMTKIRFADAINFAIDSTDPVDIKGDSFVNDNPDVDGVTAMYIKSTKIRNDAAFAIDATGADAKKGVSVAKVKVGNFTGGTWTGPGDGGKFHATSIDDWTAKFDGVFNSVKSKTSISDSDMQFGSAKNIVAKTDITNTDVTFTDDFNAADTKQRAFKKFKSGGLAQDVNLVGDASFGKIELGKAVDFSARSGAAGVAADALAAAAGDFDNPTIIDSVKIKGIKGDPIAMDNVFISAEMISKIVAVFAAGGAGNPFGFAAMNFPKGFGYKDDDGSIKLKQVDLVVGANPINAPNTRLTVNVVPIV
jgi:hypothetical protein